MKYADSLHHGQLVWLSVQENILSLSKDNVSDPQSETWTAKINYFPATYIFPVKRLWTTECICVDWKETVLLWENFSGMEVIPTPNSLVLFLFPTEAIKTNI